MNERKDGETDCTINKILLLLFFNPPSLNKATKKIKKQNFKIDTTEKYIVKTIWTKKASDGLTGIFVRSRKSSFNFKMSAYNLSAKDQELALKSFKTIVFTDK